MHEFFIDWFGRHAGRELGNPKRWFTDNPEDLERHVNNCARQKRPCFISVQPFSARDQVYGLEKLYFDFDCKDDPSKSWLEAEKFAWILKKHYDVEPFIRFSGRKGYNIDVFLRSTGKF